MAIVHETTSAEATGSGTTLVINKPTGVVSEDVMVAVIGASQLTVANLTSGPSGWTQALALDIAGVAPSTFVYYLVAGGSEPSTYTWTFGITVGSSLRGAIARYSGVDNTTPQDVAAGTATASSKTSITAPAITTVTNGAEVLSGGGVTSTSTLTAPAGLTQWLGPTGANAGGADKSQATAGTTGTFIWTLSVKTDSVAFTWALRPVVTAAAAPVVVMQTRIPS
jgi:hypothetical protein